MTYTELETVTKIDYFGNPYQVTILKQQRKLNLGELWEKFKAMDRYSVPGAGHDKINVKAIEDYENRLLEPK